MTIHTNAWSARGRLSPDDDEALIKPFSEKEIKHAIFEMKEDSAPGPDGFGVAFFKNFWEMIKDEIIDMVNDFYLGNLDISRLNYGVITLLPKIKNANTVKNFRPICLLNVCFKIFTRLLLGRLTSLANKLIGRNQTAFIKGRAILDSVVVLHEVLHELRHKKNERGCPENRL